MNKHYKESGLLSWCSDCTTGLGPKDRVSICCLGKRYRLPSKYPNWLWDSPSLLFSGYQKFFLRELKRPGYEANKSPTSNAEIKMCGAKSPSPMRLHGVVLN